MKITADLQIHTNESDGFWDYSKVIARAGLLGLEAISVTDHNYFLSASKFDNYYKLARAQRITLIEGVELSTKFNGIDIHLLGYSKKFTNRRQLRAMTGKILKGYKKRGEKLLEKIAQMGYDLKKSHFSAYHYNYLSSNLVTKVATEKFGREPNYWTSIKVKENNFFAPTTEAIKAINESNGISIIAHPGSFYSKIGRSEFEKLIEELADAGLDGIEYYHFKNSDKAMLASISILAKERNLTLTGGSDFHGKTWGDYEIGSFGVAGPALAKLGKASF